MKRNLKTKPKCCTCQLYYSPSFKCNVSQVSTPKCPMIDFLNELEKELQKLKDSLWLDIRQEEDHQRTNPEIDPTASNMAIYKTMGRRYQIEQILGETSPREGSRGG